MRIIENSWSIQDSVEQDTVEKKKEAMVISLSVCYRYYRYSKRERDRRARVCETQRVRESGAGREGASLRAMEVSVQCLNKMPSLIGCTGP